MDNESVMLFKIALGIGLTALVAVGLMYWHLKRKFTKQARELERWVT